MRVAGGVVLFLGRSGEVEVGDGGDVEGVLAALLVDRGVDGRLEALRVDDQPRLAHRRDVLGAQLDLVRLGSGLGQAGDRDVVAADLLRPRYSIG